MGICQGILDASLEAAEREGADRIKEIRISVGELTEVVEFALQFAFESLTPGTLAEGAVLTVTPVPAASRCPQCGTEFEHDRFESVCPTCGNPFTESVRGRELLIDSIEIDKPGERAGTEE
jgi:hydrogenase nickel incorporation protein HypA/HybF